MSDMNEYLRSYSPLIVSVLAFLALVAHSFGALPVQVSWVSVGLLVIIVLAPYAQRLERISIANFEMELRSDIDRARRQVDESIDEPAEKSTTESAPGFYGRINRIEILLNDDPLIAVADIRSEITRLLWMFAEAEEIGDQRLPVMVLLRRFESDDVLDPSLCESIREVIRICNRAIHEGEIRQDEASDLVDLGIEVTVYLHSLFHEQVVAPVDEETVSQEVVDKYRNSQYEVKSIVPYTEDPQLQTRIVPQSGLDTVLEGYHEYAEFLVAIDPLDSEE